MTFGALVATARTLPMPAKERVRIKTPAERRWQGKKMPSIDLVPMTTGNGGLRRRRDSPRDEDRRHRAPAGVGRQGRARRRQRGAEGAGRGARRFAFPRRRCPSAILPLGGVAVVAKNTWAAMKGRDALKITWDDGAERELRQQGVQGEAAGSGASARARRGAPTATSTRRSRRRSAQDHGRVLRAAPVARADGAGGRGARVSPTARWKRGRRRSRPQDARKTIAAYLKVDVGEGDGARDAAGRRLRAQVEARLRLRGGVARARGGRAGARAVDARGRSAEQLLPLGRGASSRGRRSTRTGKVTAWLHRSAYPAIGATFAPNVTGPDAGRAHQRRERHSVRHPEHERRGVPGGGAHAHRLVSQRERHPSWLRDRIVRRRAGARGGEGSGAVPARAHRARPQGGSVDGRAGEAREQLRRDVDRSPARQRPRAARGANSRRRRADGARRFREGRGRGIAVHRSFLSYVAMVVEVEVLARRHACSFRARPSPWTRASSPTPIARARRWRARSSWR